MCRVHLVSRVGYEQVVSRVIHEHGLRKQEADGGGARRRNAYHKRLLLTPVGFKLDVSDRVP